MNGFGNDSAGDELFQEIDLFAWMGEDERGSKKIGLKIAEMPCGLTPLVVVRHDRHKIDNAMLRVALQQQVNHFGKTIFLARYAFAQRIITLEKQE